MSFTRKTLQALALLAAAAVLAPASAWAQAAGDVDCAGCVNTPDIADQAVTGNKLAQGSILTGKLADRSVTGNKIAPGAVLAGKLANGAVRTGKIADGAVTGAKIAEGTILTVNLAPGVTGPKAFDALGVEIGPMNSHSSVVLQGLDGVLFTLFITRSFILPLVQPLFTEADCMGAPHIVTSTPAPLVEVGTMVDGVAFVADAEEPFVTIDVLSRGFIVLETGVIECLNNPVADTQRNARVARPVTGLDLSAFVPPFEAGF